MNIPKPDHTLANSVRVARMLRPFVKTWRLVLLTGLLLAAATVARGQTLDTSFNASLEPNVQFSANIYAIAVQPDGKIVFGGAFTSVLGVARNKIARMNADGTLDLTFNPNADGDIYCIAVQPDGKILVGGVFNTIGGQMRPLIARLDATTGAADTAFNANANANPGTSGEIVHSIAVQTDGNIVVAGLFPTLGGQLRNNLARLGTTGAADSFNPNVGSTVRALAIQRDGKILAGGLFTTVGATTRNRIARWNSDGTLDSFDPNVGASTVRTFAIQADGKILVGGQFNTTIGGQMRSRVARLDPNTGLADSFNPSAGGNVYSIVVQADSKILLSGLFTTLSPNGGAAVTRNRIARVNADGTDDSSFDPNADFTVNGVALQADGKVLVGGDFLNVGGGARSFLARLNNNTAATQSLAATVNSVTWTRGGSSVQFNRVTFESSPNNVTFTALGAGTPSGSNWTLTGLSLPAGSPIYIRARGYYRSGYQGGSESGSELVQSFTLPAPPTITNGPPPATAAANTAYNFAYTYTGFPAPIFTSSGTLPTGLSLSSAGVISGTPSVAGMFSGIQVTASNGVAPNATTAAFGIAIRPVVTSSAANSAANAPTLTINGFGFASSNANNAVALSTGTANVTTSSPTQLVITFTTPPSTGNLTAVVTSNAVSSGAAVQVATVPPAPTVASISPSSGPTAGGTPVTITGSNFIAGSGVTIGGTAATGVTVVSATSITATTPARAAGVASVLVTGTNGANAANTLYTYVAPPTLAASKLVSVDNGATYSASAIAPPGTSLIYKLIASNTSTAVASQVRFSDALPAGVTIVAGSGKFATATGTTYAAATGLTEGVGGYTAGGASVDYNPGGGTGTVAASGTLVLFFRVTINAGTTGTLTNNVAVNYNDTFGTAQIPTTGSAAVTVQKLAQTLSFGPPPALPFPVDGTATVTATSASPNSGNAITYTSLTSVTCSVNSASGLVTGVAIGTCTIAANQLGNSTYNDAAQVAQSFSVSAACDLDINGDSGINADKDGVLLSRYLLGFRGASLIANVPLGAGRADAQAVEVFISSGSQYDVFGRTVLAPTAHLDSLVLIRLMLAVPDASLLGGLTVPSGAAYTQGATVRANVNRRCGTTF
jgi:uncharacterized delta-60 repeat protein